MNNIKEDILNGSFEVASAEAQLIHNLPTNVMEVSNWNERHFFLYEIRSYLNKVKDFSRVRTVIVLAGRIGAYMDTTNKANK
ncbi:MAG: hypothetical protein H7A08_05510 [Oceanospirillaceae bacterium]|nr:hypothetical protein [Oceanospirillaceae bacterium]